MCLKCSARPRIGLGAIPFLVLVSMGCGDESTPLVEPNLDAVVTVTVTPSEITMSALGESVSVHATALNAAGDSLTRETFTWTSDTSVARFRANQLIATGFGTTRLWAYATSNGLGGGADVNVREPSSGERRQH